MIMKRLKKIVLLTYVLCASFLLAGCAAGSQTDTFANLVTPIPTEAPIPTAEPTQAPVLTEVPAPTQAPVLTEAPAPTEVPIPTEALMPTATPAPTKAPAATPTLAPSPSPSPSPLLNYSEFYAGIFNVYSLSGHYADGVTDIDWVSSDPSILQVCGNDLIGIYPGKTTITGTYKGATVTADVTVYDCGIKGDDVSIQTQNICLFPGESFRLLATQKNAVFTTADTSVATVSSDGTVTAHAIGTTIVTATNPMNSIDCTVKVVADDGTYLKSSLDTDYPLTQERTVMVSDSFYLIADIGVYLPEGILDDIELIMAMLEKETGLSFSNPKLESEYMTLTKPAITIVNDYAYDYAYGGADGVTLSPYDIYLDESGTSVLVHELLHTLQLRNGIDLGNAMSEGFAMYYADLFCKKLPFPQNHDEYYNSWACMGPFDKITLENTEDLLLNPPDIHPFSYFFVRYLAETYGDQKVYEIIDAITEAAQNVKGKVYAGQMNPLSQEAVYEIIKAHTSDKLTEEFYRYFSGLEEPVWSSMDLSESDGTYYVDFTGTRGYNITSVNGLVKFNQEITLDYTYAFDFAEKVWGRKAKGISLSAGVVKDQVMYDVDTTFYDQYDNVIAISNLYEAYENGVSGAVKVTLRGENECICYVRDDVMFGE